LLGLFFVHEDGINMFLQNISDFQKTTWCCMPEHITLDSQSCENLTFFVVEQYWTGGHTSQNVSHEAEDKPIFCHVPPNPTLFSYSCSSLQLPLSLLLVTVFFTADVNWVHD
jgi:hypothetical protein